MLARAMPRIQRRQKMVKKAKPVKFWKKKLELEY
jgi:hypothetical protein